MEPVRFMSQGVELAGDLWRPPSTPRGALVLCQGFGLIKAIWMPEIARHVAQAGYLALTFDFRRFGLSGGHPRRRLLPREQIDDLKAAVGFLAAEPSTPQHRIAALGLSFGGSIALAAAAEDPRIAALVAVASPMDCARQFRLGPGFDAFMERARRARADFDATGALAPMSTLRMMARDPAMVDRLQQAADACPAWTPDFSFESMVDIVAFCPEAAAHLIAPRPALWIYGRDDALVPLSEGQAAFDRAREPKAIHILDNIGHSDIHGGEAMQWVIDDALDWLDANIAGQGPPMAPEQGPTTRSAP